MSNLVESKEANKYYSSSSQTKSQIKPRVFLGSIYMLVIFKNGNWNVLTGVNI